MYNVSSTYLEKIVEPSRYVIAKVDIGGVTLDESIISSFEVDNSMGSDRMPTIGSSIAGKLKITLLNDASVPANLTNVDIKPYVAVQIGAEGVFEWIPLGVFRAETGDVVRNKMTIDIECFDKMPQLDTITYQTELEFPTDTLSMLTEMASNYGLEFSEVPASATFSEKPEGSVRQVLTHIASLLSTNVKIDRLGKVKFVFTNTVAPATFTFDDNNYIDFSLLSNSLVKISQLRVGEELVTGDDTGISLMFENPAVTEQSVLDTIFNRVYPLEFYSYKMTLQGMPHLDDGDIVTFTDVFGIIRTIIVANHKISYNGGLRSEIGCDAPQSESKEINVTSGSTIGNSLKNHSRTFEEAIRNATDLLSGNAGGNFVIIRDENDKPVEFLIMDTDNIETAQNIWKWNINGLGYGSNGYYGNFETAITAAGEIVADFITAGELNADVIKSGRLSAPNGNAWIDLDTGYFNFNNKLKFDANGFSLILSSGNSVETEINNAKNAAISAAAAQLDTFASTISDTLDGLQDQIDGSITTWFYGVEPTTSNVPASTWNTTTLKNNHLGDLYYNTVTGYAYRWQVTNNVYSWVRITDTDVTKALEDASKAQDTADSKRRVFTVTPTTPYEVGDLWSQGAAGELMRCKTTALTGSYSATHWEKASKYTDDTAANAAATAAANAQTAANTANTALADIASDSKLTATEKQATKKEWDAIVAEKAGIEAQATLYSITTEKTNYTNAYNALNTYITPLLSNLTTTSTIVGTTFRTNFTNYYTARQVLLDKVAAKAKDYINSEITALDGKIDLKVSKNDIINQINISTEGISISGNKVNISANSTYTSKIQTLEGDISTATNTANDAKDALDNLQVGGRNYLLNSMAERVISSFALQLPLNEATKAELNGADVMVSFDAKHVEGSEAVVPHVYYRTSSGANNGFSYGENQMTTLEYRRFRIPMLNPPSDLSDFVTLTIRKNDSVNTIYVKNIKLEKGNIATDWTPAPEDIEAEMDALAEDLGDVSQAITDLDGYVDGAFHDGVIDAAEAKAIEKYLNVVNTENADVGAKYTKLYGNGLLTGTAKTDLLAKKNLYNTAHTNLISAINTAISDGKATAAEKTNVDSKFTAYKTALTNLSTAFETASAYLVNVVNGKIEGEGGILTRLNQAEQKIEPNAIISTVEERVSVDGSLVLATKSDITQTKDEWKATFSQVGGVNLIEIVNSTNGYYLSATGSAAVNASWAYTDYIEVVSGDKYFVSGFTNLGTAPSTCFYSSTKTFISGVAGSARETVIAPANAKYMRFSFLISDKPNLMLEKEGGTRTSSTAINNEGVTVEDSIAPNKTTIFPSGMMVRNKETLKQLLTVEPDLTYIPELSADNIYSDSISRAVGNYSFQEINYYVAPTATGDGTGRDTSNKADNIQTALRNATNDGLILKNVNIIINVAPGKYNGLIRIMGYSGNGEIAIMFGAGVYINGNIDIIDCSCRVRLNSGATGNFVLTKGTYLNPITVINCSHVLLERPVIIHPLSTGYPIYVESSKLVVSSYDIAGSGGVSPVRAVYADYNSQVYMMFGKGNTQNGAFNASRGSIITAYYGIPNPALSSAADCDTTTGTYFGKNTSRANSSATPPTIAWQTVTKTFQGRLYRVNNATGYRTDGSFIQGTSPNTGDSYKGYVSWGKEIYDYLQDNGGYQSLSSIKLITERGGYGYGNVSMKVASPAARTGTAQARYSTAETELVGYTLGTSVSTSQNLILSTTTTATADYANFTKVLLKITVQKKV